MRRANAHPRTDGVPRLCRTSVCSWTGSLISGTWRTLFFQAPAGTHGMNPRTDRGAKFQRAPECPPRSRRTGSRIYRVPEGAPGKHRITSGPGSAPIPPLAIPWGFVNRRPMRHFVTPLPVRIATRRLMAFREASGRSGNIPHPPRHTTPLKEYIPTGPRPGRGAGRHSASAPLHSSPMADCRPASPDGINRSRRRAPRRWSPA